MAPGRGLLLPERPSPESAPTWADTSTEARKVASRHPAYDDAPSETQAVDASGQARDG